MMAQESRAIEYLTAEVQSWRGGNGCFSCHNNGDGARALLVAHQRGVPVPQEPLRETIGWLTKPDSWDPKPLARVQFAAAMQAARTARMVDSSEASARAAELIAGDQSTDGHWKVDEELAPGSAVTYGPVLGTWLARSFLKDVDHQRYQLAIERADAWMKSTQPKHVLDLAALVWALGRKEDVARLIQQQTANGSWNAEPFDTAVALIALTGQRNCEQCVQAAKRGRHYLLSSQLEPGGWPGTTRPAGGGSYAQHISTSAWALLALLEFPR